MVGGDQGRPLEGEPLSADPGDAALRVEEALRREVAEGDDDPGPDELELLLEERPAGLGLLRLRVPIPRGPALERVADVHVRALQAELLLHELREELTGRTDEGLALLVLVVAGGLADEHDVGLGIADPEDRLGPDLAERAGPAGLGLLRQTLQRRRDVLPTHRPGVVLDSLHGASSSAQRTEETVAPGTDTIPALGPSTGDP